jgi:hypothetical protein
MNVEMVNVRNETNFVFFYFFLSTILETYLGEGSGEKNCKLAGKPTWKERTLLRW